MNDFDPRSDRDPLVEAAVSAEQDLLSAALQRAQAEYLFDRVVALSAEVQRLTEELQRNAGEGDG